MCGEYGEKLNRPHYHACLFGYDFPDKEVFKITRNGDRLYTSKMLHGIWDKQGFVTVGDVTLESAAYVARYIVKKQFGDTAFDHYWITDPITGQTWPLVPEYTTMSRRPGIGSDYYEKFSSDVFPHDEVVIDGKTMKAPRFYLDKLEEENPRLHELIKKQRKEKFAPHAKDCTPERLEVREFIHQQKANQLKRNI